VKALLARALAALERQLFGLSADEIAALRREIDALAGREREPQRDGEPTAEA